MRLALILGAAGFLAAQPVERTKASDYPVRTPLDSLTLAADYLVHSIPTPRGALIAADYLVVEVAFFGPHGARVKLSPDHFGLRVNGHGDPLEAQLPGMVALSIKVPSQHPQITATGGVGDGQVTVGPRPPPSQFPGDGNDRTAPTGAPTIREIQEEDSVEVRVQNASLAEGQQTLPRSGLLYFPYRGRTKNIHKLELIYEGPLGKTKLTLLP
jgi:hypothetical protein